MPKALGEVGTTWLKALQHAILPHGDAEHLCEFQPCCRMKDMLQAVVAGEESSGISAVVASTRPKVAALMSHWLTCEARDACEVCGPVRKGAAPCTSVDYHAHFAPNGSGKDAADSWIWRIRECTPCTPDQLTMVRGHQNKGSCAAHSCDDCMPTWSSLLSSQGSYGPGVVKACGGLGSMIRLTVMRPSREDQQHESDLAGPIVSPATPDRAASTEPPTFSLQTSMEEVMAREKAVAEACKQVVCAATVMIRAFMEPDHNSGGESDKREGLSAEMLEAGRTQWLHILEHAKCSYGSSDAAGQGHTMQQPCGVSGCAATRTLLQHLIRCPNKCGDQMSSRARRTRSWYTNNTLKAAAGTAIRAPEGNERAAAPCNLCASVAAGWKLVFQDQTSGSSETVSDTLEGKENIFEELDAAFSTLGLPTGQNQPS